MLACNNFYYLTLFVLNLAMGDIPKLRCKRGTRKYFTFRALVIKQKKFCNLWANVRECFDGKTK